MAGEFAGQTRKKAGLMTVGLILLTAVIGGVMARSGIVRGDEPGTLFEPRGVVPMLACDGCDAQQIRLYYIGLPAKSGPMADPRVRAAIWVATDTGALAGSATAAGNVGFALSAITPDQQDSYTQDPLAGDLGKCVELLTAAGYSASRPLPRFAVDVPLGDAVAAALVADLGSQWTRCGIQVELHFVPPADLMSLIEAGSSTAFLMSIDGATDRPYGLVERLYLADSRENYADVPPEQGPQPGVQALLADARATADPAVKAEKYRKASAIAMTPGNLGVIPLAWRYDIGPSATWPPTLIVEPSWPAPGVLALTGVAVPRSTTHKVTRIRTDWGDGTVDDRPLPASHAYQRPGRFTVIVTAYHEDGRWTARALRVVVSTNSPATSVSYGVTNTALVSANRWQATMNYSLNGTNDGHWMVNVYYLNQCRDATGKKLGTSNGVGGLLSQNGGPLPAVTGTISFEFSATITSDEPSIQWPVTCAALTIATHHPEDGPRVLSPVLPAVTTWQEGATVVHCTPKCLGGW